VSYLPLHTVYRQWSDRCKKVAEPLFSCYVFVRIALRECLAVLQTEGAVNLVSFNGTPAVIPADQIEAIQRVLVQNLEVVRADYYAPGERVRVVKGPLQNVEGTLLIQKSNQRLIVRVEGIRQAIAFEINPQHVERIGAGCVAY
jgi:transcription antitermination factor NusG